MEVVDADQKDEEPEEAVDIDDIDNDNVFASGKYVVKNETGDTV